MKKFRMIAIFAILVAVLIPATVSAAGVFYCSTTDATGGDGSYDDPWACTDAAELDIVINDQQIKNYNDGDGLPDPYNGNGAAKNFPTMGSNYLEVSAIEDIKLSNGNSFTQCLKVENGSRSSSNYYWYAPGVGLVRYVIGVDPQNYPEGEVVGEVVLGVVR